MCSFLMFCFGFFVGGAFGVLTMALMVAAGKNDKIDDIYGRDENEQ